MIGDADAFPIFFCWSEMANIKTFCALMPTPQMLAKVERQSLVGDQTTPPSHLSESKGGVLFENLAENLSHFLHTQILQFDVNPCFYVYQIFRNGRSQVGLWTVTEINDYSSGKIKRHESTIPAREEMLANYLIKTGVDANPVLLTYLPDVTIDTILYKYMQEVPAINLELSDSSRHLIWRISDEKDLNIVTNAFKNLPSVYIADGHHRAASMAKMAAEKRIQLSNDYTGQEEYNYFSSVYMNTDEIQVFEYNRLVRDTEALTTEQLLTQLSVSFKLTTAHGSFKPESQDQIGMYFDRQWYRLDIFPELIDSQDTIEQLGVNILQRYILKPILNICDPRNDLRLSFESGLMPITQLEDKVNSKAYGIAFVLMPVSIFELIKVADANQTMPPKSTWIEPKFPEGLLIHYFG